MIEVLDLFSAAAGGWSLGMHRAGYTTIAACEVEAWRRALDSENNPLVRMYDDVRTLTADRLLRDLGRLPTIVVGSPPCQDISSANTKGRGVEGERSGLYFEAVRIIGECRPRWFALENSANLRTRGADAVVAALEAIGYTCWPCVVRAGDIDANHERPRAWLIGCDLAQVTDPNGNGLWQQSGRGSRASGGSSPFATHDDHQASTADTDGERRDEGWGRGRCGLDASISPDPEYAKGFGHEGGRAWGHRSDGVGAPPVAGSDARDPAKDGCGSRLPGRCAQPVEGLPVEACWNGAHASGERPQGQPGRDVERQDQEPERADVPAGWEVGLRATDRGAAIGHRADWSLADLADHLRLDDGLSARLAGHRVDIGDGKGQSAASLIVEAFGDAVIPQIPEAIGRAIWRVEDALSAIYRQGSA